MRDGEIVGLEADNNGGSCAKHECCGDQVFVDTLMKFEKTQVWYQGKWDEAMKVVLMKNKKETCTVAFLPRNIAYSRADEFHLKYGKILEFYNSSDNSQKRKKVIETKAWHRLNL